MKAVKGFDNKSTELRLRMEFVRLGLIGWQIRPCGVDGAPDFLFPKEKIIIFVDGCFWHGCPKCGHIPRTNKAFWKAKIEGTRSRDRKNTKALRNKGFKVIRFWEHELRGNLTRCLKKILSNIGSA